MAVLSDSNRENIAREWIRKAFVDLKATANLDHLAIKAAVDAADAWADQNQSSFNTALPLPFRTTATVDQKTLLLCYVILKRSNIL